MGTFVTLLASGIAYGAVIALVALGILVLVKATGVINLAHGGLLTIAPYVALWAMVDMELPLGVAYVLAIAAVIVVALLLERLVNGVMKGKPHLVLLVATLGVALVIGAVLSVWQGADPKGIRGPVGSGYLQFAGVSISYQRVLIIVVATIGMIGAVWLFERTDFGRQVRALAADREVALMCGIRVNRVARLAFVLSGALAAVAGLLLTPVSGVDLELGFSTMLVAFAAATIGGFDNLRGTAVAALAIGVLQQVIGYYFLPDFADILPFAVMLVAVVIRPAGVFSAVRTARV